MKLDHTLRAGLIITMALALAGCAQAQTSTTATPDVAGSSSSAPTATPTLDGAVSSIVLSGAGVSTANAAGETLTTIPFEQDAVSAVALLTDTLGESPVERYQDSCRVGTYYTWSPAAGEPESGVEGLVLHVPEEGDIFQVTFTLPTLLGIDLRISTGQSVGDDVSSILADASTQSEAGYEGSFMWDVASYNEFNGARFPVGGVGFVGDSGTVMSVATAPGSWGAFYC